MSRQRYAARTQGKGCLTICTLLFRIKQDDFQKLNIPSAVLWEDMVTKCDIILDATSAGVGEKNRELYAKHGKKAIFQGGEKNSVADVFFHGYANYQRGSGNSS